MTAETAEKNQSTAELRELVQYLFDAACRYGLRWSVKEALHKKLESLDAAMA